MEITEWLDQYRRLEEHAMQCARRLDEARHQSLRSPSFDRGVRHSGTFTLDLPVAKIEAEEKQFRKAREKLFARLDELGDMVEQLEDYEQKLVLMYRYMLGKKWSEIVKEMPYCERSVQRIHGKALKALQEILNGRRDTND